jgi:hypothetical protein
MHRFRKRRPTPAMAVAFTALFVALSGLAVAGPSLPGIGTVHSNDIHNGQVRSVDIRNNTVRGADVRTGTLRGSDVRDDSLTGADILESSLGPVPSASSANTANTANSVAANGVNTAAIQNNAVTNAKIADDAVTSPKIAADAVGASELKGTYAAVSAGTPAAANTFVDAAATCNAGDTVLGGGFAWLNDADEIETVYSTPDPLTNPNRWIVRSRSGAANTLFAWAVCLAA